MPPSEYSFRLQRGITGGFAPPTPSAIHIVTRALDADNLQVSSSVRPDGQALLEDALPKTLSAQDTEALVHELHSTLKELPTEQPPGSEDIYGLDCSIFWGSEDLQWCNGGPQGCSGGVSSVQATPEQKEKFKRAIEIIEELKDKAA